MSTTSRALAFASLWFDAATVDRVFAPLIADWQREWSEAPSHRRSWIIARGIASFATAFLVLLPRALFVAPLPPAVLRRVIIRISGFMAVACGILLTPFLVDVRHAPLEHQAMLLGLVLPSIILFAFPFATSFIVDTIRTAPGVSPAQRIAMAQVALAAALFVGAFGGWVVPGFNRLLRIETRGYDLPADARGVRELTTAELIFDPSLAPEQEPYSGGADRATRVRAEIQNRAYVVALPLLLVWLRWRNLELPRRGWLPLPAGVATVLTFILVMTFYFGSWRIERALGLPRGTSVWLGIAALAAWGLLAPQRRRALLKSADLGSRLYKAFQNSRIA